MDRVASGQSDNAQVHSPIGRASASSSSLGAHTAGNSTPRGAEVNEHQVYQRLRLKLVQLFGSLAAALYELGADSETGRITRKDFLEVCSLRLNLLTPTEANLLFSHITSRDIMNGGSGSSATFRDFQISEEDWRNVVLAKEKVTGVAMPFQSGPGGSSMGLYHRRIHIETVSEESPRGARATERQPSPRPGGDSAGSGAGAEPQAAPPRPGMGATGRNSGLATSGEPRPWRRRQSPWIDSTLRGDGPPLRPEELMARGRPGEQTLRMAREGKRLIDQPKYSQLGSSSRGWCYREGDNAAKLATEFPTRRCEMEPARCARQADDFWPYKGPRPPPRLRAIRQRLLSLSARG